MKKIIISLFVLSTFVLACSEKSEDAVEEEIITVKEIPNSYPKSLEEGNAFLFGNEVKSWKAFRFNLSSLGVQSCRLDDSMQFKNDGTYAYDNGSEQCGGDVLTKTGTFVFDFDNKKLIFDEGTSDEVSAEVTSLSANDLKVIGGWSVYQISTEFRAE